MNGKIFDPLKTELDKMKEQEVNKLTENIKDPQVKEMINSAANTVTETVVNTVEQYATDKIQNALINKTPTTSVVDETSNATTGYIGKIFSIPLGKVFTSTSFFVIVYLLAWWANSRMGYNFNLDDLLYLYYIVIGKNVVTYGIDSVANSKRGSMPTKPTSSSFTTEQKK